MNDIKLIQLQSINNPFQRIPFESTMLSTVYANNNQNKTVYYSTTTYKVPATHDISQRPEQKTTEYCLTNFGFQQNCVLDFDCAKDENKNPLEGSLEGVTSAIVEMAQTMCKSELRLNKDFFVYFTGRAGYRLVIPADVIGADFECGQFATAENTMKRFAHALITRYSSEMNQERLTVSLDNASFTKDRIMLAGYSVNPKAGGMLSFFLDDSDVKANISLDMVREKSNNITAGKVSKIDFSEVSLEKNEILSALFEECRTSSTSFHEEKKENIRNKKSHTKTGPGNQNGWSCTDNDKKSPPGEWKPFYRLKNKPVSAFDCHCMKYFLENCNNLDLAGENRFEYCLIMAILATKLDDRDGLKAFYKKVAEKNRPGQDTEKTAEEWTLETYNSLKNRPISCKNIISKKAEGEAGKSIVDYLNEKFEFEGEAGFRCKMNCPLYSKRASAKPNTAELNTWALDFIFSEKIITYINDIYRYDSVTGCYTKIDESSLEKRISAYLGIHFTEASKNNVIAKIKASSTINEPIRCEHEICLNNGILNIKDNTLQPHTHKKHFFDRIDACYDPNGPEPKSEIMDKFFETLFPEPKHKEQMNVLLEFLGYTLILSILFQLALILLSDGESGKTTLMKIWIAILRGLGVSMDDLKGVTEKEQAEDLKNRTLCYVDDINSAELLSEGKLKSRITGGIINYNTKYVKRGSFTGTAKYIFGSNQMSVNTSDFSHGFMRRFIIVEFPVNFAHSEHAAKKSPDIDKKILSDPEAKNRFFYLALQGLKRLMNRGKFDLSPAWRARQRELLQSNNIYLEFARNFLYYQPDSKTLRAEVYKHAKAFAAENGKMIKSAQQFWRELERVAKCSLTKDKAHTHYFKSNGHEYLKNIALKGIEINDKGKLNYIIPNNETCNSSYIKDNRFIKPEDVSITEATYRDCLHQKCPPTPFDACEPSETPLFDVDDDEISRAVEN